jgi:hypothetical protein
MQNTQQQTGAFAALNSAYPSSVQRPVVLTVRQFSQRNPAFTESALRNLIFKADERPGANCSISGNGLLEAGALIRIGRKVLIDEAKFFGWIDAQQKRGASNA